MNEVNRKSVKYSSTLDVLGFHSNSKNFDTQIISAPDNLLENGTSEAIRKYLNEPVSIGVDASILNQQLLFLMNVPNTLIDRGTTSNKF